MRAQLHAVKLIGRLAHAIRTSSSTESDRDRIDRYRLGVPNRRYKGFPWAIKFSPPRDAPILVPGEGVARLHARGGPPGGGVHENSDAVVPDGARRYGGGGGAILDVDACVVRGLCSVAKDLAAINAANGACAREENANLLPIVDPGHGRYQHRGEGKERGVRRKHAYGSHSGSARKGQTRLHAREENGGGGEREREAAATARLERTTPPQKRAPLRPLPPFS